MKKLYLLSILAAFGMIGFGLYALANDLPFLAYLGLGKHASIQENIPEFVEDEILPSVMPASAEAEIKTEEPPKSTPAIANPEFVLSETAAKKLIEVDLSEQRLRYFENGVEVGTFLISSGLPGTPTPKGEYRIQFKRPVVLYKGEDYYFPNTKWNLQFLPHYYIHGAYWHNNFGKRMSHGCVNVSYANMEGLYNWAEVGVKFVIHD